MTMAHASRPLLLVLALLAGALCAPAAEAGPFAVSCKVDRDEGQGELRIVNSGTWTIPETSIIQWHASNGRGGSFPLYSDLEPGQRTFEFNSDTVGLRMGIDTCTASVASHPPLPVTPRTYDPAMQSYVEPNPGLGQLVTKCKHCDKLGASPSPVPSQAAVQTMGQGGGMALVTGDVDVYDVPDGVGTVIGMLRAGTQVPLVLCRADQWCQIQNEASGGPAWVWGEFLQH